MRNMWRQFWSNAATGWYGMPTPMRWFTRVVVLGAIALLLYHLLAGSL